MFWEYVGKGERRWKGIRAANSPRDKGMSEETCATRQTEGCGNEELETGKHALFSLARSLALSLSLSLSLYRSDMSNTFSLCNTECGHVIRGIFSLPCREGDTQNIDTQTHTYSRTRSLFPSLSLPHNAERGRSVATHAHYWRHHVCAWVVPRVDCLLGLACRSRLQLCRYPQL